MASEHITISKDELREIVRQMVVEVLEDIADGTDPDAGKTLKPEIIEYLRRHKRGKSAGTPIQDVIRDLGLDVE